MGILPNCYDEEDFEDLQLKVQANDGIFTALCLGKPTVYQRHDMLFDALSKLRASGAVRKGSFYVRFVGGEGEWMRSYAEAYSCSDLVESISHVSHKEAMSFLKQATCLLLPQRSGALGRRVPEYMAARKPILTYPWDDTSASQQILEGYRGAIFARNSEEIAKTLTEWYKAFKAGESVGAPVEERVVQSFKGSNRALELQGIKQKKRMDISDDTSRC
jgi:glycosyltransferase involved in cell wall biosynthesis